MYLGQMVESAPAKALFKNPMHPYTKALLSAIPVPDPDFKMERIPLKGELTSPINRSRDADLQSAVLMQRKAVPAMK